MKKLHYCHPMYILVSSNVKVIDQKLTITWEKMFYDSSSAGP